LAKSDKLTTAAKMGCMYTQLLFSALSCMWAGGTKVHKDLKVWGPDSKTPNFSNAKEYIMALGCVSGRKKILRFDPLILAMTQHWDKVINMTLNAHEWSQIWRFSISIHWLYFQVPWNTPDSHLKVQKKRVALP